MFSFVGCPNGHLYIIGDVSINISLVHCYLMQILTPSYKIFHVHFDLQYSKFLLLIFIILLLAHLAKVNVSFCHHLSSVVVNFSHFNLFL